MASAPIVHPETFPDAGAPYRTGQLVQSKHGYFYVVENCYLDSFDDEWWIRIYNEILDIDTEVRCSYLRKPNHQQARSTFRRII